MLTKAHNKTRRGNVPKQDLIDPIPKASITEAQLVVAFSEETQKMQLKDGRYSNYAIKPVRSGSYTYSNGVSLSTGDHIILDRLANIKENDLVSFGLHREFYAVGCRIGIFKKVDGENVIIEMPSMNRVFIEHKSKLIYLQKIFGKIVIQRF